MKVQLVFRDWQKEGQSIYNTEEGYNLSAGQFHSGTTFDAEVDLLGYENELKSSIKKGYEPVFYVILNSEDG